MTAQVQHNFWRHPWLFRLAISGAVISLSNVFSFPVAVGQYGGPFIAAYLLAHLLIAMPILMSELLIGRRGRQSAPLSIAQLAAEAFVPRVWRYLGVVIVVTGMAIASYYLAFSSWALDYGWLAISGQLAETELALRFTLAELLVDPLKLIFLHTLVCLVLLLLLALPSPIGMQIPVALMALCLLAGVGLLSWWTLESGAWLAGLGAVFNASAEAMTINVWTTAVSLSFYSLGVGLGVSLLMGVHMEDRMSVGGTALWIIGVDVFWSILFAASVLAFVTPGATADAISLLFVTLPEALFASSVASPTAWLSLFYVLLLLSGLSTGLFLVKGLVMWLHERFQIRRILASAVASILLWLAGAGVLLSFNIWREVRFYGATVFEWLSVLPGTIILPLIAFLLSVFVGWKLPQHITVDELKPVYEHRYAWWRFAVKFVTTSALLMLLMFQVWTEWAIAWPLQAALVLGLVALTLAWQRYRFTGWERL
ncbi:hypothetical protein NFC81_12500 [Salinispirillum sp. LH 10-3-1]|uniref:Sodium-dependent transporter n=1 Tax=Salinispirillum sp. LH 10-3-1 TaxID=2952525 RepID=A0AB38YER9_9GAMM